MSIRTSIERQVIKAGIRYWSELMYRTGTASLLAGRAARGTFRDLWDAEVSVFSQWGEDGILDFLCESLGLARPNVVEFGAGNFLEFNSRFLAEYRNARVMAVDAQADLTSTLQRLPVYWRTTIDIRQEWITPDSAPRLLAEAKELFGGVDIVSLDIDGNDYWVAECLDLSGISVVVVEYNPLFGATRCVTVPRDDAFGRTAAHFSNLYYGASIRAFQELLANSGFELVGTNRAGNNAFFVPVARRPDVPLPVLGGDLSRFTDWRVRESRDQSGKLTYLSGKDRLNLIGEMPLIDTGTGEQLTVLRANS